MSTSSEAMTPVPEAPPPVLRPFWALWLWDRKIEYRAAGAAILRSHEWVRLSCLPFDDPRRVIPDPDTALRIERYTKGAVTPGSFLDDRPASEAEAG